MDDLLYSTLCKLGYPVFKQGSLSENDPYPDHFFTFWNNTADGDSFYDNDETSIIWDYDLNFYTIDPNLTSSKLMEAKSILKETGFIATGAGYDVESDEPTHTGRGMNVFYRQKL